MVFFEGAEKKAEIVFGPNVRPLRTRPREFWERVVHACDATILSAISNSKVDAYLLSESSLFVWDDRLLILTCGQTKLVESILLMIEEFGSENLDSVIYQRKNEYRADEQHSSFKDDVNELKKRIDGRAMRFGKMHSHHNLLFHLEKPFSPETDDTTTEMLMYDICKSNSEFLTKEDNSIEKVRDFFQLDLILPGFEINDHLFKPYGYSLNAIKDENYYTIHVTPQEGCPYVSFETNLKVDAEKGDILRHFLKILRPESFDVISFNAIATEFDFGNEYKREIASKEKLAIGYEVDFGYYFRESTEVEEPFKL